MISEEQLQKLEQLVEIHGNAEYRLDKNTCDSDMQYMVDCTNAVPALIAEVRRTVALWRFTCAELREKTEQLEKEADWLAKQVSRRVERCPANAPDKWREAARKATENK